MSVVSDTAARRVITGPYERRQPRATAVAPGLAAGLTAVPITVIVTVLVTVLTGCGNAAEATGVPRSVASPGAANPADHVIATMTDVVLVIGVHRNAPAPSVPQLLAPGLRHVLRGGGKVALIALDGRPSVLDGPTAFPVSAANAAAADDDVNRAIRQVMHEVTAASADDDGSDVLAALSLAADTAAAQMPGATIVLEDSLLPDRGDLDLTVPGMLGADPRQVVDDLRSRGALPHLAGRAVLLVGGGFTVPPQAPLNTGQRSRVVTLWEQVVRAAGGTPYAVPLPRTGEGPRTSHPTRPVPLPVTTPVQPGDTGTRFADDSPLGFTWGTTTFREPQAARVALTRVAAWLRADARRHLTVTGTCDSTGTPEGWKSLSGARAERVREVLVELGVPQGQVTPVGAGHLASPPDRRPDGSIDSAAAALNRSIRFTFSSR